MQTSYTGYKTQLAQSAITLHITSAHVRMMKLFILDGGSIVYSSQSLQLTEQIILRLQHG